MGKKSQKKHQLPSKDIVKKLPIQKRNELNQLMDELLQHGFNSTNSLTEQWDEYVQMKALLTRIQTIEAELKIKLPGGKHRTAQIDAFLKWAKENGASFDGVTISEFPNYGLGLEATKEFKQGDIFAIVPKSMIMSLDNASTAITPMMYHVPMIEYMSNVKLAFTLLVEKLNANSFWKPYIDILPEKYSTVMNFSVIEMQELKGSNALSATLHLCKNIARQYAYTNKFIQRVRDEQTDPVLDMLKDKFTYDLYCWAASTVMTRQNAIPRTSPDNSEETEAQPMPALIPFWDIANHIDGVVTSSYNVEKGQIEGAALGDFKKGDQIFIYYGVRNNTNLLVHNGFVYPENSSDSVSIKLGLSTADPLIKSRSKLLDALSIPTNCELDVLPSPKYISPKLLGFVRVFNMNEDHLNHWLFSERCTDLLHLDCALDTELETKTWIFLKMRLILLLKAFPTTLQEDQILLENHKKGQNKMGHIKTMLVQFRITEKRILSDALEYVEQRTKP